MTKQELIDKLADRFKHRDLSKAGASDVVESLFHNLSLAVRRGKRFSYPDFGTLVVRKRKERRGRNPQSGQEMQIAASKTVLFRPAAGLKTQRNK